MGSPALAAAEVGVHRAGPEDVHALTRVLVQAYMDDPLAIWITASESLRARTLYGLYTARLQGMLAVGEVWTDAERSSVSVWLPPGARKPAMQLNASLRRCLLDPRLAVRLPLLAWGLRHMDGAHPRAPVHWYLSLLGTDPAQRGRGLGSAMLQPVLARCDETGVGAYLESSKQRNIGFYERHGFRALQALRLPAGPTLWPMWREPRRR